MGDHQRADSVLPGAGTIAPNFNQLSREGVTFTQTFCPSPHCCPARATFMSGLYPSEHGIWNNVGNGMAINRGLNDGVRLWSEDMRDAGYKLAYTGKWHVSSLESPKDRGWEELYGARAGYSENEGTWNTIKEYPSPETADSRGEGEIIRPGYTKYTLYGSYPERKPENHDEKVTATATEFLQEQAGNDEPWMLFTGWVGPHDPYIVPQKYLDMYDLDDIGLPESYYDEWENKPYVYKRIASGFGQLSEREIKEGIRHFRAYCTYLDDMFGEILRALDKSGQADNTVVVYCSDHGDYCGEHGLFAKGIPCYQGAYRVPLIIRYPEVVAGPGRRVEEFVSLADVGPTLLELAGVQTGRHFTGESLAPFIKGEIPDSWRDAIHTQCNGVELYYSQRSVMTREFKYVFNGYDQDELYDLRKDPHELVNLANDPGYAEVVRDMCRRHWEFARKVDDSTINPYITVGLAPWGPGEILDK